MTQYDSHKIRNGTQKLSTKLEYRLMHILQTLGSSIDPSNYSYGDYTTAMNDLLSIIVPEQKHPSEDTIQVARMLVYTGPRSAVERTLARSAVKRLHIAGDIEIAEAILGEVPTILACQTPEN